MFISGCLFDNSMGRNKIHAILLHSNKTLDFPQKYDCLATEEHVYNLSTWKAEGKMEFWDNQIV